MFKKDKGALASRGRKKKDSGDDNEENKGDGDNKDEKKDTSNSNNANTGPKMTSALLRIQKDLADLELPNTIKLTKEDEYNYSFAVTSDSGLWQGGIFEFKVNYPKTYPFSGPKVTCVDKIYHPNIDLEGGVCVNVLRPWKPTYNTQHILFGLLFLFTDPNPNDPLNNDAAKDMRENKATFAKNVTSAMKGGRVGTVQFPKNKGF